MAVGIADAAFSPMVASTAADSSTVTVTSAAAAVSTTATVTSIGMTMHLNDVLFGIDNDGMQI